MAIIGLKTPILSKKPVYCRPKKSIGCPFHDFSRKYHYPLAQILSKKRSFSKKIRGSDAHLWCKKRPFSINTVLSCNLIKIFMKNHLLSCIWLVKKRQFCRNYDLIWAKKVNRMPFFLICHEKISTLIPYCVKNVQSLNNKQLSYPYLSKNIHSLRTTVLWCHFFQNFSLNTP